MIRLQYKQIINFKGLRKYTTIASERPYKIISKSGIEYYPTIGLEIHTQLNAKQKLFSTSKNSFENESNTNINKYDLSYPGILPVLNLECVNKCIQLILSLDGQVQQYSSFDRKHYFYPDMPNGYQITQKYKPLGLGGKMQLNTFDNLDYEVNIEIEQIQLEQDSGNLIHDNEVKINLNRVNNPLIELVTKPQFKNSKETVAFVRKLQILLRSLDISNANMELGELRCDVNVSISRNKELGIRTELKNLNTFKNVGWAIDAEIQRQIELIESGNKVIQQTLGFDVVTKKTFILRNKENLADYRYLPDPDLPQIKVEDSFLNNIKSNLSELPDHLALRFTKDYQLSKDTINTLLSEPGAAIYFDKVMKIVKNNSIDVANWITSVLFGLMSKNNIKFENLNITVDQFASVLIHLNQNDISDKMGKKILLIILQGNNNTVEHIIKENKLYLIKDKDFIRQIIEQLIKDNPTKFNKLKNGDHRQKAWFLGMVMKCTDFRACPKVANDILDKIINSIE